MTADRALACALTVLALIFAITCALGGSLTALYATSPHQPHTQPANTTDTSTSQGACQEGHR